MGRVKTLATVGMEGKCRIREGHEFGGPGVKCYGLHVCVPPQEPNRPAP